MVALSLLKTPFEGVYQIHLALSTMVSVYVTPRNMNWGHLVTDGIHRITCIFYTNTFIICYIEYMFINEYKWLCC